MGADKIDHARDYEREELFASPQRFRFEDGWLGYLAVPGGQPHEEIHEVLLEEGGGRRRGRKEQKRRREKRIKEKGKTKEGGREQRRGGG